jgi:hypothetical protein
VYMGPKYKKFISQPVILYFTKNVKLIFCIMEIFDSKVCFEYPF